MGDIAIEKVERGSELAEELLRFVEQCSWIEARDHMPSISPTSGCTTRSI